MGPYRKEPDVDVAGIDDGWGVYDFNDNLIAVVQTETMADALICCLEQTANFGVVRRYSGYVGYTGDDAARQEAIAVDSSLPLTVLTQVLIDVTYDQRLDAAGCSPYCDVYAQIPDVDFDPDDEDEEDEEDEDLDFDEDPEFDDE